MLEAKPIPTARQQSAEIWEAMLAVGRTRARDIEPGMRRLVLRNLYDLAWRWSRRMEAIAAENQWPKLSDWEKG